MLRTATLLLSFALLIARPLAAQTASTSTFTSHDSSQAGAAGIAPLVVPEPDAAPTIYHVAEEMPTFPGGSVAFQKFLRDKLHYPEEALRKNLSGKVHVSFVVDEQGHILDPKVVRGLGSGLDEEALRLVRIMPWWTPGRVQGKPVRVAYTLPIVFRALE